MTQRDDGAGCFVLALGLAVSIVVLRQCSAEAQDVGDRATVQRCLVAEAPPGPEYADILAVLSRRGRVLSWAARHYCAALLTTRPSARQALVRQLPGGPGARLYARHWRAAGEALDAWERGERSDCDGAVHFGDRRRDAARARRMGWREVSCGHPTANAFWRLR